MHGSNGLPNGKRRLENDSGGDAGVAKKRKEGKKKKATQQLPGGLRILRMVDTSDISNSSNTSQPIASLHGGSKPRASPSISTTISPPPNRHPHANVNPDDRPLPPPRQMSWDDPGPSTSSALSRPIPPPRASSLKPTSRTGSSSMSKDLPRKPASQSTVSSKSLKSKPLEPLRTPTNVATSSNGLHATTSMVPLPVRDTPLISKNREMRKEKTERRKSSMGARSARVSESFGAGIVATPHAAVESSSFYTHISPELPEAIRIRQLLVWCAHRAVSASTPDGPSSKLPSLSASQSRILSTIQEDVMKMMCLGKVSTSLGQGDDEPAPPRKKVIKEHPRNVINQQEEKKFQQKHESAKAEDLAWSEAMQALNSKQASVLASFDERLERKKATDAEFEERWKIQRARLKGKQKSEAGEDGEDDGETKAEAKACYLTRGAWSSNDKPELSSAVEEEIRIWQERTDEEEQRLRDRFSGLEVLIDDLHQVAHTASMFASRTNAHLTKVSEALAARLRSRGDMTSSTVPLSISTLPSTTDPLSSLRALSRTAGDGGSEAARKAALDVERGVGERKLTAIPMTPSTRKAVGTPRKSVSKK
ncbi:hypothetical protein FRC03_008496 [Tulasnella sp. 419]|nr:hypothetical protein FRC03_008496 [Tulasnella sp. 419]